MLVRVRNGAQLEFRVRAEGTRGLGNIPVELPWSNLVAVTVQSPYTPLAPTSFKAYGGNQQVTLRWKNLSPAHVSAHITRYQYQQNGGKWKNMDGSNALTTRHTVRGLTNGTDYTFKVRAVAGSNYQYILPSEASTEVSATPKAPVAPTLTVGPVVNPHHKPFYSVTLGWTVPDDAAPHALVENVNMIKPWYFEYRVKFDGDTNWSNWFPPPNEGYRPSPGIPDSPPAAHLCTHIRTT